MFKGLITRRRWNATIRPKLPSSVYIEIIGEAANRIQKQEPEFVAAHPSLPWPEMRGMRNRMIHNYFDVNIDVLWGTVKDDLPQNIAGRPVTKGLMCCKSQVQMERMKMSLQSPCHFGDPP